jgi:flavin reductase (DIM6/NTAB) family NADH-FMN oxidoreductase RutF
MKLFVKETQSPPVFPRPVALVTMHTEEGDNIITLSWVGTVCSSPPVIAMGIRKNRYSHGMIVKSGEFVVNIPGADRVREADFCGTRSGEDTDKFQKTGFTKEEGKVVKAPLIKECPINMECKLMNAIELGSHTVFLGEVVGIHFDERITTGGTFDDEKFQPEGNYGFTKR